MSNPVWEPFIEQVPFPDSTDDADPRRCLFLELFFLRSFFLSDDESNADGGKGGGDGEVIATNFLADSAAALFTASTAIFASRTNTAASVTIALEVFDITFALVATWTIVNKKNFLMSNLSYKIDNWKVLRAPRSAPLINAFMIDVACQSPFSWRGLLLHHPTSPFRPAKRCSWSCKHANVVPHHRHGRNENLIHTSSSTLINSEQTPFQNSLKMLSFAPKQTSCFHHVSAEEYITFLPPLDLYLALQLDLTQSSVGHWLNLPESESLGVYEKESCSFLACRKAQKGSSRGCTLDGETNC